MRSFFQELGNSTQEPWGQVADHLSSSSLLTNNSGLALGSGALQLQMSTTFLNILESVTAIFSRFSDKISCSSRSQPGNYLPRAQGCAFRPPLWKSEIALASPVSSATRGRHSQLCFPPSLSEPCGEQPQAFQSPAQGERSTMSSLQWS